MFFSIFFRFINFIICIRSSYFKLCFLFVSLLSHFRLFFWTASISFIDILSFSSFSLNIFGRPALPLGSILVSGSALLLELDTPGPRGRVPLGSRQQLRPGGVAGVLQRDNFSRSKHGENMEKTSDLAIENLENLENVDLT